PQHSGHQWVAADEVGSDERVDDRLAYLRRHGRVHLAPAHGAVVGLDANQRGLGELERDGEAGGLPRSDPGHRGLGDHGLYVRDLHARTPLFAWWTVACDSLLPAASDPVGRVARAPSVPAIRASSRVTSSGPWPHGKVPIGAFA